MASHAHPPRAPERKDRIRSLSGAHSSTPIIVRQARYPGLGGASVVPDTLGGRMSVHIEGELPGGGRCPDHAGWGWLSNVARSMGRHWPAEATRRTLVTGNRKDNTSLCVEPKKTADLLRRAAAGDLLKLP